MVKSTSRHLFYYREFTAEGGQNAYATTFQNEMQQDPA